MIKLTSRVELMFVRVNPLQQHDCVAEKSATPTNLPEDLEKSEKCSKKLMLHLAHISK